MIEVLTLWALPLAMLLLFFIQWANYKSISKRLVATETIVIYQVAYLSSKNEDYGQPEPLAEYFSKQAKKES